MTETYQDRALALPQPGVYVSVLTERGTTEIAVLKKGSGAWSVPGVTHWRYLTIEEMAPLMRALW